jgi:predicted nucleic acid-binding protein
MRVLLDLNVLLDALMQRLPWHHDADAILQAAARGEVLCATTTLSLATLFYVGRKTVGDPAARAAIRHYLATFEILPVDRQILLDADALADKDFEDNILIAAAVSAKLDAIVTRNVADFSQAPIPVWEPSELLKRLSAGGSAPAPGSNPPAGLP